MESRTSNASELTIYDPALLGVVTGPLDGPPAPGCEAWVGGALMYADDATNQAVTLARLDAPVRLHSHMDIGQVGAFVDEILTHEGVDTSSCERVSDQNVAVSLPFDGDHVVTTCEMAALLLPGGDAPTYLLADVWGIGASSEVVSSWRARGTWVLADTAWDGAGAWDEASLKSLLPADVYMSNREEALTYARTKSVEDATRRFVSLECGCAVICGKNDATARVGGQALCMPVPAMNTVDTTDAEGIFSATLVWACRARHIPWPKAFALACMTTTHSMQGISGSSSAPYVVDLPGT